MFGTFFQKSLRRTVLKKRMMRKRPAKVRPKEELKKAKKTPKKMTPRQVLAAKMASKKTTNPLVRTKLAHLPPRKVLTRLLKLKKKKMTRPISNLLGKCWNSPKPFSPNTQTPLRPRTKSVSL